MVLQSSWSFRGSQWPRWNIGEVSRDPNEIYDNEGFSNERRQMTVDLLDIFRDFPTH